MGPGCTTELVIGGVTTTVPEPSLNDFADSAVDPVWIVSLRYEKQQHLGCQSSVREKPQDDPTMAC